jgi:hypothetical protein
MPDLDDMRIPVKYLANMLTGGKEAPIRLGLKRMMAMRHYMRSKMIRGQARYSGILDEVGLTTDLVEDMYKIMAIANYEDRYVIPTGHREETLDAYGESGGCGFSFGNGCSSHSNSAIDLFEHPKQTRGQSGSTKDNRVNTIFERDHYEKTSAVKNVETQTEFWWLWRRKLRRRLRLRIKRKENIMNILKVLGLEKTGHQKRECT